MYLFLQAVTTTRCNLNCPHIAFKPPVMDKHCFAKYLLLLMWRRNSLCLEQLEEGGREKMPKALNESTAGKNGPQSTIGKTATTKG